MSNTPRPTVEPGEGSPLPALVTELATSTESLCAVAAASSLRATGGRAAPPIERALAEVVAALGLTELLIELERSELRALASAVQARISQAHDLAFDPTREPGSRPPNWGVIESQDLVAETLASALRAAVVSRLAGLQDRLAAPRSTFLDMRVGVAGLAIALCRLWPSLSGVGLEISEATIGDARRRVEEAGLSARIELRVQDVTQLEDRDAFDLVWLPASFIGESVLPAALWRARRATRAGGWIILNTLGGANELSVAVARLRAARAGGTLLWPSEAECALIAAGWADVSSLPRDILPALWMTVGRRPGSDRTEATSRPPGA